MDRLTGRDSKGVYYRHGKESGLQMFADRPHHECREAIERLADYEDTGLTAEEILELKEKQALFENEVGVIRDWFVDNKECLLDTAQTVGRDGFIASSTNDWIDEVDFDFIIEDIVNELHKGILNVLDTFKDS